MSDIFNRQQVDDITAPWLSLCKEQEECIAELEAENKELRELWLEWDSIDEKEIDSWEAKMRELVKPPKEGSSDA